MGKKKKMSVKKKIKTDNEKKIRLKALEMAVELKIDPYHILVAADQFFEWITLGKLPKRIEDLKNQCNQSIISTP